MNSLLRALVALVIVAAVIRGGGLLRVASMAPPDAPMLRPRLGLPPDHRVSGLIASTAAPQSSGVLWWDASASTTAILADANGRLRIGQPPIDIAEAGPALLTQLDPRPWPELPPQWQRLTIAHWDAGAAVYVTAGPDGLPGIAGIDDDGNGSVDDLAELGATGSDDFVVAPGQVGYEQAAAGNILARLISRGALIPLAGDLHLPTQHLPRAEGTAAEVWLEFAGDSDTPPQQILLRSPN